MHGSTTYEETKEYLKNVQSVKRNTKLLAFKSENFAQRIKRFKREYDDICLQLSGGKATELAPIRQLTIYNFETLLKHKNNV